jgi:hypothetical protein
VEHTKGDFDAQAVTKTSRDESVVVVEENKGDTDALERDEDQSVDDSADALEYKRRRPVDGRSVVDVVEQPQDDLGARRRRRPVAEEALSMQQESFRVT